VELIFTGRREGIGQRVSRNVDKGAITSPMRWTCVPGSFICGWMTVPGVTAPVWSDAWLTKFVMLDFTRTKSGKGSYSSAILHV